MIFHISFFSFLDTLNEYYWMSIKCMYFSSVINLTIPDYVNCSVFSSAVAYIPIQNVKNKFTLYFTLLLRSVPRYNLG
jgi:hypothetical protein